MEKERKSIDSGTKFSWKIKWILAALLLVLWSSSFSYAQENDSLQQENRYEKIDFKKMNSYIVFDEFENIRQNTVKYRNSIFEMTRQLFTKDDRFWFPEFDDICEEANKLLEWIENEENCQWILSNLIRHLEYDISVEKNVECRKALTKILSIIKDKKNILNWVVNDPLELLKQNLRVWDIILINKKNSPFDIWTKALKIYDDKYLTDFTHVLIFIWFDEDWNILVRHSTTATEKLHRIGVENTRLDSYIFDLDRSGAEWYDLVVLRPDPSILQSILELSEDKLGSWYDNLSALRQWLWLPNTFNNKYNCVELVTQSIKFDETKKVYYWDEWDYSFLWQLQRDIENIYIEDLKNEIQRLRSDAFPANILESSLFTNVYLTTINKR